MKTDAFSAKKALGLLLALLTLLILLAACGQKKTEDQPSHDSPLSERSAAEENTPSGVSDEESMGSKESEDGQMKVSYECISQDEAKRLMDEGNCTILDVREQSEYDEGHIEHAILLPYTEIEQRAEQVLPDKDALILVYCRSGRRSKIGAQSLADLGYTNVKEFGGIIDWQYGTVK